MRKLLLLVCLLAALIALPAAAQTQITIDKPLPGNPLIFTGDGSGNVTLTLTNCCTITGTALSTGDLVSQGFYTLDFTGSSPIQLTSVGGGIFTVTQGGPIAFSYGTLPGGSDLLTGDLQLVSIGQTGSVGVFNQNLTANLTNLGGSLASAFGPPGGVFDITIRIASGVDLSTLEGSATANISSGELTPTPEPASLALLGGGLLSVGGFMRRKLRG